jgi:3'(2'), 5'-bisphosphate nucleotidase
MTSSLWNDGELATELARTTGQILLAARKYGLLDGQALGAAGDAVAHEWITRVLAEHRAADGVLSEEAAADPGRLRCPRVWIVDPLDGTREFSEGRADWAVHIALVVDGDPVAAAVALPGIDAVFSTAMPHPLPNKPLRLRPRIAISRTRPPAQAQAAADRLGAELVPMGSAGFKAMAVLRGDVDAYVHAGGQYEWDSAAPVGVAARAGLHVSRLDGSRLIYNNRDPYLPDLLICRPDLATELLATMSESSVAKAAEA